METADAYLERKWREVALLRNIPHPTKPRLAASGALAEKQKAALVHDVHRAIRFYPPTNWTGARRRSVGDHRFDYGYQRFDLTVRAPAVYPGMNNVTKEFYCRSGMAALAALCQAFDRVATRGCDFLSLRDAYFEAQHLIDRYCKSLSVKVAGSFAELMSHHHEAFVLHLDSICSESPEVGGVEFATGCVLALIDTTCYARTDPIIARLAKSFVSAGTPVALVRSHLKLDTLGMEIGQLGSVVMCAPPDGEGACFAKLLGRIIPDVIRVFGLAPSPADFFPVSNTADLLTLSTLRAQTVRANTKALAKNIATALPTGTKIRCYHHGMFLTLHDDDWSSDAVVQRLVAALVADCTAAGGTLVAATSFGFDFSVVQDVFDVPTRKTAIRLAPSDEPIETFSPLLAAFGHVLRRGSKRGRG